MQIDNINVYQVRLPFSQKFSHSQNKGLYANNIIVEVVTNNREISGYGEGSPRIYVTGESQKSSADCVAYLVKKDTFPWQLDDVHQIWDFIDSLPHDKFNNAAICSIELALLDALAREQNRSLIEYFSKDFFTNNVFYGAAIPIAGKNQIVEICELILSLKIDKIRIKMGKDLKQNRATVETVKDMFRDGLDIRIDANGAWDRELALSHVPLIKDYNIKVVEQPLNQDDPGIAQFAGSLQTCNAILMADESACSMNDIRKILEERYYGMVNIRLSKCGGFRKSIRIIDCLRSQAVPFQIGCQLGESGILSAAGRALSLLCGDAMYYDGSYDKLLLKENITRENVSFGYGGKAGPLDGPGLGIEINHESLKRLCNSSSVISIPRP